MLCVCTPRVGYGPMSVTQQLGLSSPCSPAPWLFTGQFQMSLFTWLQVGFSPPFKFQSTWCLQTLFHTVFLSQDVPLACIPWCLIWALNSSMGHAHKRHC